MIKQTLNSNVQNTKHLLGSDVFHFKYALIAISIGIILILAHYNRLSHVDLLVDFLDIGQGDAIFITTPHNQQILIDGGPDARLLDELGEVMPFLDRTIDLVILTHPQTDHLSGLIELISRYQINKVLLTGVTYDTSPYDTFLAKLKQQSILIEYLASANDFTIDGVFFDVLYPFTPFTGQTVTEVNNSSLIIQLVYGANEILFTGDAEEPVEDLLLRQKINIQSNILKVGHHGSRSSSGNAFLQAVNPQYAVIQVGEGNRFGHPNRQTLEKLVKAEVRYFRNDWEGRVRFTMDEKGIKSVQKEK